MRLAVLRFPGSACDDEVSGAIMQVTGETAISVAPGDRQLPRCDAVIVLGGPVGAARAPAMKPLRVFASTGGPVLGICGGFPILCQAGLLPGTLVARESDGGAGGVHVRVEGRPTPFTAAIPAGRVLPLAPQPVGARYVMADADALEAEGQIIFRYTDAAGGTFPSFGIAGVCNARGNVVALGPHLLDGKQIFTSLRMHLRPPR